MSETNERINNNQNTIFNNVNNKKQISSDNVGVDKNSYNSNIKDYLVQRKADENKDKNKYNLPYKADGAGGENISHDGQNIAQQKLPQNNQNIPTQDGNQLVNNIYYPNNQNQDNNINDTNLNDRKYFGSSFRDIIRSLYDDVKNSKISQYNLLQEMENLSKNIEFSKEPTEGIDKAVKEQKKVKKIKDYNNMSDDFAVLVSRLFKNSDEKGAISITDYQEFLDGPVKDLKKKMSNTLAEKGKDKDETVAVPGPLKTFLVKSKEEIEIMENNNNIAFNPTKMRKIFGDLDKNLSDAYENITVFEIILMAIYNFFYGDFYQENKQAREEINEMIDLINSFYSVGVEDRQKLINKMNEKVAKIEFILGNTVTTKQQDWDNLKKIKEELSEASKTSIDSIQVVFDLIKSFGQEVVKNADIKASNKDAYKKLAQKISEYLVENTRCSKEMGNKIAIYLLNGKKKEDLHIKDNRIVNILFEGQMSEKRNKINEELNNVNKMQDVKIEAYTNLKSADIICKTADMLKKTINAYVEKFQQQLETAITARSIHSSAVESANFEPDMLFINNAKKSIIENIKLFINRYKSSVFAYEDNTSQRENNIKKEEEQLKKLKDKIKKITEEQLLEKDKETGKSGKAKDVGEMLGLLDKDNGVCNITGLKYAKWEDVVQTVKELEQQLDNSCKINMKNKNGKSLLNCMTDENKIKYNTQNDLFNKFFTQNQTGPRRGFW